MNKKLRGYIGNKYEGFLKDMKSLEKVLQAETIDGKIQHAPTLMQKCRIIIRQLGAKGEKSAQDFLKVSSNLRKTIEKVLKAFPSGCDSTDNVENSIFKIASSIHIKSLKVLELNQAQCINNRYQLLELLGQGGMAKVFKAFDNQKGKFVAIKTMLAKNFSQEARTRFVRESAAMHKMGEKGKNRNIVQNYESFEQNGVLYLVMECVEGQDLSVIYGGEKERDYQGITDIIIRVARTLDEMHKKGLIHRDIKPANIMLPDDKTPKVMDFGLVKSKKTITNLSQANDILGTPHYMSPNQLQSVEVKPADDVYSLGATLYFLLTGEDPYGNYQGFQVIFQKLKGALPLSAHELNSNVPMELSRICEKAMDKEEKSRYRNMQRLIDDLLSWKKGEKKLLPKWKIFASIVTILSTVSIISSISFFKKNPGKISKSGKKTLKNISQELNDQSPVKEESENTEKEYVDSESERLKKEAEEKAQKVLEKQKKIQEKVMILIQGLKSLCDQLEEKCVNDAAVMQVLPVTRNYLQDSNIHIYTNIHDENIIRLKHLELVLLVRLEKYERITGVVKKQYGESVKGIEQCIKDAQTCYEERKYYEAYIRSLYLKPRMNNYLSNKRREAGCLTFCDFKKIKKVRSLINDSFRKVRDVIEITFQKNYQFNREQVENAFPTRGNL